MRSGAIDVVVVTALPRFAQSELEGEMGIRGRVVQDLCLRPEKAGVTFQNRRIVIFINQRERKSA